MHNFGATKFQCCLNFIAKIVARDNLENHTATATDTVLTSFYDDTF